MKTKIAQINGLQEALDARATKSYIDSNLSVVYQSCQATDNNLAHTISDLSSALTVVQNWKSAMTNADSDSVINTLTELLDLAKNVPEGADLAALLAQKINTSDIVNNLTSVLTNVPLSAYQGNVLKGLIDTLNTTLSTTYATKTELANASTPPSLAINKTGANGVVSLQIFSYPVALKVTAVTIMSNSTNISVQIGSTTYDKNSLINVTLPANTEMSVLDLSIKAGYTSGSAIITFAKA
jgi:hypothetical protein